MYSKNPNGKYKSGWYGYGMPLSMVNGNLLGYI